MKHFYFLLIAFCLFAETHPLIAQQKPSSQKGRNVNKTAIPQYFNAFGDKINYVVYNTDTTFVDSGAYVTKTVEYVWDTINSGYIFVIKEIRFFCDTIKPEVLGNDLKNMISIIPENGFKLMDKNGGELFLNIEEAFFDGGEDSVFISVNINGYIGGSAEFEESGVVGLRYPELKRFNDSLYKRPDIYPMNRFGKPLQLR